MSSSSLAAHAGLPPGFVLPFRPRRVVVANALHAGIIAWLRDRRPDLELRGGEPGALTADDFAWAEVCIGFRRPAHLPTLGGVQWVHSTGAGVDGWLMGPPLDPRILVTRSPELFGGQISEWAISRIFAIQLGVLRLADAQRRGVWDPRVVPRIAGTRALLIGTGDIGRTIATKLSALGVACTGVSRSGRSTHPAFTSVHPLDALPALVADHDWLICSLPDTTESRGLLSRALLSQCRGAVLLNAGRGAVVDEAALPEALDQGWLRAAALDVFEVEPLPPTSPLWSDPRVMISPHMSGPTTVEGAAGGFLECLAALERGELPGWVVERARGY